jgi:hypothetical protein
MHDRPKAMHALEGLSESLSPLRLPHPLTLKVQGCDGRITPITGITTLWFVTSTSIFCSASPLWCRPGRADPTRSTRRDDGPETGHAVFDMLEIPFLGHEEGAADQFSAYMLLQMGKEDARRLILGVAYLGCGQAQRAMAKPVPLAQFAGVHALPTQRYFGVL